MRHGDRLLKLSRKCKPRYRLLRNLVTSLVEHERIVTTKAKARAMRGLADRIITLAKKPKTDLARKKQILSTILYTKDSVDKVINELLPRFENKKGNYTIVKHYGYRKGDCAKMSLVEYHGNNYYIYEKDATKDDLKNQQIDFTIKLLHEEASFFKESLENLKNTPNSENQQKFFENQLTRVQRELSLLDKSTINI